MVHALSQSIKKCFLIVIYVVLFMTPVHLSEKIDLFKSSGNWPFIRPRNHRVTYTNSVCLNFYSLLQIPRFIFVLGISSVIFMYEFWLRVCFLEYSVWVLALRIKERYALVQVMHVKNSFGFLWISFYEQIEYKYLYSMAWLSAQLLKMIKKME